MRKSEIFYLDDNNNIVSKEDATHTIIREMDDDGNLIREIYGIINEDKIPKINLEDNHEFTKEEQEFLAGFIDKDGNHPWARKK